MQPSRKSLPVHIAFMVLIALGLGVSTYFAYPWIEREVLNEEYIAENISSQLISEQTSGSGLRKLSFEGGFKEIPDDVASEEVYKDVRLISTETRVFSPEELGILKRIIDIMPQRLFEYRPWAIISTTLYDVELRQARPGGVAYASGPNIFVGDNTFVKKNNYDTGTFRGLYRIFTHEFTHVAQFFTIGSFPENYQETYLENSSLVQDWIALQGWEVVGSRWSLGGNDKTTAYGRESPVEDMADSVGTLLIGDEFVLSPSRVRWVLNWLGMSHSEVMQGTLPLRETMQQRKVDPSDLAFLEKHTDKAALTQDVINFQSTERVSVSDFARTLTEEFESRGWNGSTESNGKGEFLYKNLYRVHFTIDDNPLRVVTMVLSVY
ncbi:MAG: hypothetical protein ACOCXT_03550 [Candidatus Dojkabacteria bacterium]